jgi:ribosomal protein S6
MKKLYDLTYWARISSDPKEVENKVLELIKNLEGEIFGVSEAQKKEMAYPIEKETHGYLSSIFFYAEPQTAEKLNFELKRFNEILRFLIVKRKTVPKTISSLKNSLELKKEVSLENESK